MKDRKNIMYPITTENDIVKVTETYFTMDDGVKLYTRVVVPREMEKAPIVYMRTPYEPAHNGKPHDISVYNNHGFIKNGYAIVLQHCRGRGDSEGICIPYTTERADGIKTLEYIRQLPCYNGEIFLHGGSYLSTVHFSYLDTYQPDIKGASLDIQSDRTYYRYYRNGCNYDFCNLNWWLSMMNRQYPNPRTDLPKKRPYKNIMSQMVGEDVPEYTSYLLNDTDNEFWTQDSRNDVIDKINIPVLFVDGWYDFYLDGMFSMWKRMSDAQKSISSFIVGPWGHATQMTSEAEYHFENGNIPFDYAAEWFNSIRENRPFKYARKGKLKYYSIGSSEWKETEYPTELRKNIKLYFNDENMLTSFPSNDNKTISYKFDPDNPIKCFRHHNIFIAHEINSVDGVVSFQTEEFDSNTTVLGNIRWHLKVSSDCDDTAFFIRIYFVEDGKAYNLTEDITTLSYVLSECSAGQIITIDLETPPIAFEIKKGNRIRVDISSNCGVYVPHSNVKGHWAEVEESKVANNTVYLQDSYIEIPIE